MKFPITCPSCSRRFEIPEELNGRIVECDRCDSRFRAEAIQPVKRGEKIQPGAKKDDFFNKIAKSSIGEVGTKAPPVAFKPAQYQQHADFNAIFPASVAQRSAVLGGLAMLGMATLFFVLGSGPDGALQDIGLLQRSILAGFTGLLGSFLLIYGAKGWRWGAGLIGLTCCGVMAAIITLRPVYMTPGGGSVDEIDLRMTPEKTLSSGERGETEEERIKKRVGYRSVEMALSKAGEPEAVVAVFVQPWQESFQYPLEGYLHRSFGLEEDQFVGVYRRESQGGALFLCDAVDKPFDDLVEAVEVLGKTRSHPDLRLIEVSLDQEKLSYSTNPALGDPYDPEFFTANLAELRHFDLNRAKTAVQRVDSLPKDVPLTARPAIQAELVKLVRKSQDRDFDEALGSALMLWAKGDEETAAAVGAVIEKRMSQNPEGGAAVSLVDFIVQERAPQALFVVDSLWSQKPLRWLNQYEALGSQGEKRLLFHLENSPATLKRAAVELLQVVGSKASLAVLKKVRGSEDQTFEEAVNAAIRRIQSRG